MKRYLSVLLVSLLWLSGFGETVSQKEASRIAHMFFNEAAGKVIAPPKLVYNGRKLTTGRLFTPFYVYNTPMGGFVIVSADNKAFPIIGFSLKDSFDPEKLGETELALLKTYALEVEYIRYDSQPVEETVWAWQNIGSYISGVLGSKYEATDPNISIEESVTLIERAIDKDNAVYSDIFTPAQWQDMVDEELQQKQSVALAIIGNDNLYPIVVYGRQGNFYRLEMTTRNNWLMRLNATEIIPANMVAVSGRVGLAEEEDEADVPFADLDTFLAEVSQIESERREMPSIVEPRLSLDPIVRYNGSGHAEILLPESAFLARVYNLSGSLVRSFTYSDTPMINVDLSSEPTGFYIVNIIGVSGTPYSFKLYR